MPKRKTSTVGSRVLLPNSERADLLTPNLLCCMGVDPGVNGGIALICTDPLTAPMVFPMPGTHRDIRDIFELLAPLIRFACIENVHSFPGQGVASTFKFGQNFGFLLGMLHAFNIPHDLISPQKWQNYLSCLSKGDKNITKSKAQRLFPGLKITHKTADALLIAEYCKRNHADNSTSRRGTITTDDDELWDTI